MSEPESQPAAQLEYAPAPTRSRKWLRRAAWLAIMLTVSFAGWRWGTAAWTQVQIVYWQRQCMNYRALPNQVVYEEEPAAVARLASDLQFRPFVRATANPIAGVAIVTRIRVAGLVPQWWDELAGHVEVPVLGGRTPLKSSLPPAYA